MPRRDLIRNVIIVGVLVLALILLRIFVFHPFSINDKMANASVKNGDLVVATRNAQVDRSDLVLYKVGGKEYLGRVIAKENDEVSYVDDVLYLNGQATPEPYLNKMLNKHLAAPTSNGYYTDDFFLSELKGTKAGRVPSDTYLVLNDNRGDTEDSPKNDLSYCCEVIVCKNNFCFIIIVIFTTWCLQIEFNDCETEYSVEYDESCDSKRNDKPCLSCCRKGS